VLEAALLGDLGTYLPHLLNRQDKNTMQHSIETRVPFLDPDVVALALDLPLEARATPERKGVLRDLARIHLPRGVANRTKLGFGFDVRRYLRGAARPEFLADGRLRETLGVPAEEWSAAVADLSSAHALRLWTGEVWCRLFLEGEDDAAVEAALWR
jgi:asparagine synthetase B (glutamine-hydrolysing)